MTTTTMTTTGTTSTWTTSAGMVVAYLEGDDLATATRSADGRLTAKLEDGKTVLVFRR